MMLPFSILSYSKIDFDFVHDFASLDMFCVSFYSWQISYLYRMASLTFSCFSHRDHLMIPLCSIVVVLNKSSSEAPESYQNVF